MYPSRTRGALSVFKTETMGCPGGYSPSGGCPDAEALGLEDDDAPLGQVMFDRRQVREEKERLLLRAFLADGLGVL